MKEFVFCSIWVRLYPDFNNHAFGKCVNFSGKQVTPFPPSPPPKVRKCTYTYASSAGVFRVFTILFPELRSLWPAVGKRALWEQPFQACAIACHRCSLRLRSETDNRNPVISYCYVKMDAPRALVLRPLVKRNQALGTRLVCSRFCGITWRSSTFPAMLV